MRANIFGKSRKVTDDFRIGCITPPPTVIFPKKVNTIPLQLTSDVSNTYYDLDKICSFVLTFF